MDMDQFNNELNSFLKHNEQLDSQMQSMNEHGVDLLYDTRHFGGISPGTPNNEHTLVNPFLEELPSPTVGLDSFYLSKNPLAVTPPDFQRSQNLGLVSSPRLRRSSFSFMIPPAPIGSERKLPRNLNLTNFQHRKPEDQQMNYAKMNHSESDRSETSSQYDQNDDCSSTMQSIAFKKSCKICTERRVKCSGPPGPCKSCTRRGYRKEMCVFLPRKKPGPKKKQFDMLLGIRGSNSSTVSFSDCVSIKFSEFTVSLKMESVIRDLKSLQFLQQNPGSCSEFESETFARTYILHAVRLWATVFGEYRNNITQKEFIQTMLSYHQHSEYNYGYDTESLSKLYWLCGGALDVNQNMLSINQFCLLFLWLGPPHLSCDISARQATDLIYDFVRSSSWISLFEGFCSRQFITNRLLSQPKGKQSPILYLPEGRIKTVKNGMGVKQVTFFIRNCAVASIKEIGVQNNRKLQVVHESLVYDSQKCCLRPSSSDPIPFLNI